MSPLSPFETGVTALAPTAKSGARPGQDPILRRVLARAAALGLGGVQRILDPDAQALRRLGRALPSALRRAEAILRADLVHRLAAHGVRPLATSEQKSA